MLSTRELLIIADYVAERLRDKPISYMIEPAQDVATFGRLIIDYRDRTAAVDGITLLVQPRQFDVLACLSQNLNHTLSRDQLIEMCWPDAVERNAVDTAVSKLRRVLGPAKGLLLTHAGVGYRFVWTGPKEPSEQSLPVVRLSP